MTIDPNTQLLGQFEPKNKWAFTSGQSKVINLTVDKNIKSIMIKVAATIDTEATAPGRSAESPFDMIQLIEISGGQTKIIYKPWLLKAIHQAVERQDPYLEDEPTVATSQSDDVCGFEITLPCNILASVEEPVELQVNITMASNAQLDKSTGSNYSSFSGTVYVAFIPAGNESISALVSKEDEDSGSGNLAIKFGSNNRLTLLVLSNAVESPSAPSAGADESKYENTITDLSWEVGDGEQFDNIQLWRQLQMFSEAQNNVSIATGYFTLRAVEAVLLKGNNILEGSADGSATRMKAWALMEI